METVSLRSLAIEYGVPSHLIKKAIEEGRLTPILAEGGEATKDTVGFSKTEVDLVFWVYVGRLEQEKANARLNRRLARNDAVLSGIVSTVAATAIVGLGAAAIRDPSGEPDPSDPRHLRRIPWASKPRFLFPIDVGEPVDFQPFVNSLMFMGRTDDSHTFVFKSMAGGVLFPVRDRQIGTTDLGVSVTHRRRWRTIFLPHRATIRVSKAPGTLVRRGEPLFELQQSSRNRFTLELMIMALMPDDEWRNINVVDALEREPGF